MYVESLYISVELFHNTSIHNTAYPQPIPSYDQIKVKKCCSPNLIGQTMATTSSNGLHDIIPSNISGNFNDK